MNNDIRQGDDDDVVVIDIPSNDVPPIESPLLLSSQQHQPVTTTKVEFANLMLLSPSALTSSSISTTIPPSNYYDYTTAPILTAATSSSSSYPNTSSSIDQQQPSQQEVVVELQARLETCHDLIAAAAAAAAAQQQQQSIESTNHIHVDNNTSQPQHHVTPITHIQGVVDLDILSEIAGVSRSDFLTDWQQPQPQSHLENMNDDNKYVNECNEATPLLLSSAATSSTATGTATGTSTTPQQQVALYTPEIVPYHDTTGIGSSIHNNYNNSTLSPISTQNHKRQNVVLKDTVLLNADAFVETLSDVLENQNNNNNNVTTIGGGSSTMNQQKQLISPYQQPINHNNNNNDQNDDIESLTENYDTCSATNDNNTEDDNYSGITPGGAFFVPRPENLGANLSSSNHNNIINTLNRNHTHAFLLEIPSLQMMIPPSSSSQNEQQSNFDSYNSTATTITPLYIKSQLDIPSHFILAFPPDSSNNNLWQDDVSDASMDNNNNNNNDDDSFLLGLSHLPTDVCDVQIEAIQYNSNYYFNNNNYDYTSDDNNNNINDTTTTTNTTILRLDVVVKRQVPFIGYVILIGGLLSLSSVGTALNLQHNVTPIMKSFWRYTCTWIILLPIAIRSIVRHGYPQLVQEQWLYFIICSMCYAFMTTAFVSALEYTTLANAFVLSNLAPLFIIVGRYIYGLPILYMEGIGSMIGFIGGSICAFDVTPTLYSDGNVHDHPYALLGDSLAVMASLAVAIYLLLAKKLRPHIDLFVFSFLLMLTSSIFVLFYMIITNEPMSFSNDINYGLWGWMNCQLNRLPLELYMAIVCNIFGTTGYIAVMKYFEPIVVSTVMLSEPVVGALLAAAVGSDPLPGIQTWIGNIVVAIGIFLVVWSGARSTETIDATKALLQVNNNNNNLNTSNDNGISNGISVSSYNDNNGMNYNHNQMGVPLLKNHPVTAAWNSPHRLKPPTNRMRNESIHSE